MVAGTALWSTSVNVRSPPLADLATVRLVRGGRAWKAGIDRDLSPPPAGGCRVRWTPRPGRVLRIRTRGCRGAVVVRCFGGGVSNRRVREASDAFRPPGGAWRHAPVQGGQSPCPVEPYWADNALFGHPRRAITRSVGGDAETHTHLSGPGRTPGAPQPPRLPSGPAASGRPRSLRTPRAGAPGPGTPPSASPPARPWPPPCAPATAWRRSTRPRSPGRRRWSGRGRR